MLRLFGTGGLVVVISAGLALGTQSLFFRLLTIVAGVASIALYLWLQRSLPARSGSLRVSGLREIVELYRDDRGVPHIYARNLHDLYLAQGYVTAQDRLWAMDMTRRTASGRMAELFGTKLVDQDRHFRTIGLRQAAEASFSIYSPAVRGHLQAFADGVNARIAEGRLHPEFDVLRYRPEPWTAVDTLLLCKFIAYNMSGNWATELFRAQLVQTVGADKAAGLFWDRPDLDLLTELEAIPIPDVSALMSLATETVQTTVGSSAWAVAGTRTRSGAPMLAADPHVSVGVPSPWYQVHLTGPDGLDVTGASFPGIPGIMIGQNRDLAWGLTNAAIDVQDVYVERLDPSQPGHYAFNEQWTQASVRVEEITVRGGSPVRHEVMVTRHGPVIAKNQHVALSLKWTGLTPSREIEAFLQLSGSHSWAEFRQAVATYDGPPQNFVVAAKDGTIACRLAGLVPARSRGDGQAPLPGWTSEWDWAGVIPFADHPESVNPPDGYLIAAGQTTPHYRARRLRERLHGAFDLTGGKLLDLQNDRVNNQARLLLQTLLHSVQEGLRQGAHPEVLSELEKKALMLLSGWDCAEDASSPAAVLWHQWYQFLVEGIFRPQMGLDLFDQFVTCGMAVQVTDRLIQAVSEGGDSPWLGREGEEGLHRVALRSFRRSAALLAAKQGRSPENWRWDREHKLRLAHPLCKHLPALRWFMDIGAYAVGGSAQTLWTQEYHPLSPFDVRIASPWRQVVDMGAADSTFEVCMPGQSGHPLSPAYTDQVSTWTKGEAFSRLFQHERVRKLPRCILHPDHEK